MGANFSLHDRSFCGEFVRFLCYPASVCPPQYEAEDGRTAANSAVRFGYDEREFPGYSWRGYAVFSPLQVS